MTIRGEWEVSTGNGWGKQFKLRTHENLRTPNNYFVQVCIFPSCSCPDFYNCHSRRQPFMPCKHLYWVYQTVFKLDVEESTLTSQAILTVGEVRLILERQQTEQRTL